MIDAPPHNGSTSYGVGGKVLSSSPGRPRHLSTCSDPRQTPARGRPSRCAWGPSPVPQAPCLPPSLPLQRFPPAFTPETALSTVPSVPAPLGRKLQDASMWSSLLAAGSVLQHPAPGPRSADIFQTSSSPAPRRAPGARVSTPTFQVRGLSPAPRRSGTRRATPRSRPRQGSPSILAACLGDEPPFSSASWGEGKWVAQKYNMSL